MKCITNKCIRLTYRRNHCGPHYRVALSGGSLPRLRTHHGLSRSPEYSAWQNMRARCYSSRYREAEVYQSKGIIVCDEWVNDFSRFISYVGPRPSEGHSLDRIDNDGNYEPGNVRWATRFQQDNNRSSEVYEFRGEKISLKELCRRKGLSYTMVLKRKLRGWSEQDMFRTPTQRGHDWRIR